MATPKRHKRRTKKLKGRIKFKQSARIIEKNDATRVAKSGIDTIPKIQGRPPATVAPVFRVKLKRK